MMMVLLAVGVPGSTQALPYAAFSPPKSTRRLLCPAPQAAEHSIALLP